MGAREIVSTAAEPAWRGRQLYPLPRTVRRRTLKPCLGEREVRIAEVNHKLDSPHGLAPHLPLHDARRSTARLNEADPLQAPQIERPGLFHDAPARRAVTAAQDATHVIIPCGFPKSFG